MSRSAFSELRLAVLAAAAAALAVVTLAPAPTREGNPPSVDAAADPAPLATADPAPLATADLADSVFFVHTDSPTGDRYGSAFAVESDTGELLVTNVHVAGDAESVTVGPDRAQVEVGAPFAGRDAVRLDVDDLDVVALPRAPVPPIGAQVTVAGFPAKQFEARAGTLDAVQRRQWRGCTAEVLVLSTEAAAGMSGGVVLDVTGAAIALVAARDPVTGRTVAYPLDELDRAGC
jgi:S1-C subfamily serine protease